MLHSLASAIGGRTYRAVTGGRAADGGASGGAAGGGGAAIGGGVAVYGSAAFGGSTAYGSTAYGGSTAFGGSAVAAAAASSQLPESKERLLKKTLFYFSRLYTGIVEQDVFAVSWDARGVPRPPESLEALLPPDEWPVPDLILIAVRNVDPEACGLWLDILEAAVAEYSADFVPLVDTHLVPPDRSHLVAAFVAAGLAPDVRQLAVRCYGPPLNAVCCRFCVHQAPILVVAAGAAARGAGGGAAGSGGGGAVCGNAAGNGGGNAGDDSAVASESSRSSGRDEGGGGGSPGRHAAGFAAGRAAAPAAAAIALPLQRLALLRSRLSLEAASRRYRMEDHPITFLFGAKDLFADFAGRPRGSPLLARLRAFDVIYLPHVSGQPSVKRFKGSLDVLKAGLLNLSVQVVDDDEEGSDSNSDADGVAAGGGGGGRCSERSSDGASAPTSGRGSAAGRAAGGSGSCSQPELCSVRVGVPTVDAQRLRHLYRSVWRSIVQQQREAVGADQDLCAVRLDPQTVDLDQPLRPYRPASVTVKISNPNKVPVAFSVLCLSDSGRSLVPVGRYSHLHRAKLAEGSAGSAGGGAGAGAAGAMVTPREFTQCSLSSPRETPRGGFRGPGALSGGGATARSWGGLDSFGTAAGAAAGGGGAGGGAAGSPVSNLGGRTHRKSGVAALSRDLQKRLSALRRSGTGGTDSRATTAGSSSYLAVPPAGGGGGGGAVGPEKRSKHDGSGSAGGGGSWWWPRFGGASARAVHRSKSSAAAAAVAAAGAAGARRLPRPATAAAAGGGGFVVGWGEASAPPAAARGRVCLTSRERSPQSAGSPAAAAAAGPRFDSRGAALRWPQPEPPAAAAAAAAAAGPSPRTWRRSTLPFSAKMQQPAAERTGEGGVAGRLSGALSERGSGGLSDGSPARFSGGLSGQLSGGSGDGLEGEEEGQGPRGERETVHEARDAVHEAREAVHEARETIHEASSRSASPSLAGSPVADTPVAGAPFELSPSSASALLGTAAGEPGRRYGAGAAGSAPSPGSPGRPADAAGYMRLPDDSAARGAGAVDRASPGSAGTRGSRTRTGVVIPEIRLPERGGSGDAGGRASGAGSACGAAAAAAAGSSTARRLRDSQPSLNLAKWAFVEPAEGVILGGNSIEMSVLLHVREPVTVSAALNLTLVVRLDNCQFDSFFSLNAPVAASIDGLTLQQLECLDYDPYLGGEECVVLDVPVEKGVTAAAAAAAAAAPEAVPPERGAAAPEAVPPEPCAKKTAEAAPAAATAVPEAVPLQPSAKNSAEAAAVAAAPSAAPPCLPPRSERQLPIPKEFWWLLAAIHGELRAGPAPQFSFAEYLCRSAADWDESAALHAVQVRRTVQRILVALETAQRIPDSCRSLDALLATLEKLLLDMPVPILPRVNVVDLSDDAGSAHLLCRAVLLSLPMGSRNLLLAVVAVTRELLAREATGGTAGSGAGAGGGAGGTAGSGAGGTAGSGGAGDTASGAAAGSAAGAAAGSAAALRRAAVEWLARLFVRDENSFNLGASFIYHFLSDGGAAAELAPAGGLQPELHA